MTTVVNKYKVDISDPDIIYIGRGSLFGNPFVMQNRSDEERARVIEEYRYWLWTQIQQEIITKEMLLELDSKKLCCYR